MRAWLYSFLVTPIPKRDFDRNFVLLGKVNSGKSTLGNLILGCSHDPHFPMHGQKDACGLTKKVTNGETEIAASIVCGDTAERGDILKIQVTDQPGTNDVEFVDPLQCGNIIKSLKGSRAELSDTFLIVCNMSGKFFSNEETISILNIAEILSHSGYMFFQNAILVFTHIDKYRDGPERVKEMLQTEEWAGIGRLLDSIGNRHLFINSLDLSEGNRNKLIKTLFKLSKPTLNVAITGNNGFQTSEFRDIFKLHDTTLIQKESEKFTIEYFLNPNLNIFHKLDKLTIDQRLEDELNKMFIISKGISVMVVLISLEDSFTREFYDLINQIPDTFSIQKSEDIKTDPLWKYSFIMFLSPTDDKSMVERNVKLNPFLKEIVSRVNNRFTWITRDMPTDECYARLVNMILKVSNDTQGTSFINNTIVRSISEAIKSSTSTERLQQEKIPWFQGRDNNSLWIQANTFNWNKDQISHIMAYFLVKNVGPGAADAFLEKFPNPEKPVSKEDFKEFCVENLK